MRRSWATMAALLLACGSTGCAGTTPVGVAGDAGRRADATAPEAAVSPGDSGADATVDGAPALLDASPDAVVTRDAEPPADAGTRPLDALEELFARRFTPITDPVALAEPATAGYHCLAAASAYRRARDGAAFSPELRERLGAAARAAADALVASAPSWGGAGWGLPDPWDAFGDGSSNPAGTVYAFQTGLAIWCLAEAADALDEPAYRALADRASRAYRSAGFVGYGSGYPIDCTTCGYFWYSLSGYDVGRMVKNTNIEMAVASLALHRYGADSEALQAGAQAASSQYGEIVSYANYGYLGRYDVAYSPGSGSFDDHNSFEAYLLLRAGELLANPDFVAASIAHYDAYAPYGSSDYVAYAACHLARVHPPALAACTEYVEANGATNPAGVGLVMDYR